jgi:hypothetical protein
LIISCNVRGEADFARDLAAMKSAARAHLASGEKTTGAVAAPVGKPAVFDNFRAYEL